MARKLGDKNPESELPSAFRNYARRFPKPLGTIAINTTLDDHGGHLYAYYVFDESNRPHRVEEWEFKLEELQARRVKDRHRLVHLFNVDRERRQGDDWSQYKGMTLMEMFQAECKRQGVKPRGDFAKALGGIERSQPPEREPGQEG